MNIGVLLFHEVGELDVVGPYSVLSAARDLLEDEKAFDLFTVAKSRNSVPTAAAMTVTPTWAFASAPPVDVLIVPGGRGVEAAMKDRALTQYLMMRRENLELLASVSSGALLLGELGYLKDKTVTTHPSLFERIEDYEVRRVAQDRVVKDGDLWTSGGSTAGLDLGLELVRHFFSDALARRVAKHLDITVSQPGLF